ncbi:MAG: hypothetical protein PHT12_06175 [Patescibacteria group bacterium]|nr:hypothetical protein [Patescibacteria group bacterium]
MVFIRWLLKACAWVVTLRYFVIRGGWLGFRLASKPSQKLIREANQWAEICAADAGGPEDADCAARLLRQAGATEANLWSLPRGQTLQNLKVARCLRTARFYLEQAAGEFGRAEDVDLCSHHIAEAVKIGATDEDIRTIVFVGQRLTFATVEEQLAHEAVLCALKQADTCLARYRGRNPIELDRHRCMAFVRDALKRGATVGQVNTALRSTNRGRPFLPNQDA